MAMLPSGILGLVFAALVAAIIASMGSKINSIATIFTMDVYQAAAPADLAASPGADRSHHQRSSP